jgi:hypothetical protein
MRAGSLALLASETIPSGLSERDAFDQGQAARIARRDLDGLYDHLALRQRARTYW